MTLEQQVTSLELSKRLKELGVKQDSYFHWIANYNGLEPQLSGLSPSESNKHNNYSAFTVAELGDMLPEIITDHCCVEMGKYRGKWVIRYSKIDNELGGIRFDEDTESNARAKMLIYLLENELLEVKI